MTNRTCCVCEGEQDSPIISLVEIAFVCPKYHPEEGEAWVHRSGCWDTLWADYLNQLRRDKKARAAA